MSKEPGPVHLSQKDVEICLGFDLETEAKNHGITNMRELHHAFVTTYKTDNGSGAA